MDSRPNPIVETEDLHGKRLQCHRIFNEKEKSGLAFGVSYLNGIRVRVHEKKCCKEERKEGPSENDGVQLQTETF